MKTVRKNCYVGSGLFVLALVVFLGFSATGGTGKMAKLSLQLRRGGEEATPPVAVEQEEAIARFDRTIGSYGIISGHFDAPIDVAVGSEEVIYVLDYGNNRVQCFDSTGGYLFQFGGFGTLAGEFNVPEDIGIDGEGDVYVVDSGNHRIQKFDSSGRFLLEWGGLGSTKGLFKNPRSIAFDDENNVYVADPQNSRIQKFSSSGRFQEEWERFTVRNDGQVSFSSIVSLAYDDDRFGYMLALNSKDKTIQKFELDGDYQETIELDSAGDSNLVRMAVDNKNDLIYLADAEGNRILRYGKDGSYQGSLTKGDTTFSEPKGLYVDTARNRLYIADTGNNKLQKFYIR